jgi:hypothetical protein
VTPKRFPLRDNRSADNTAEDLAELGLGVGDLVMAQTAFGDVIAGRVVLDERGAIVVHLDADAGLATTVHIRRRGTP